MKSLDEHNSDQLLMFANTNKPVDTNIACPKCSGEMLFEDSGTVLLSWPPKKSVYCPACNHRDYML